MAGNSAKQVSRSTKRTSKSENYSLHTCEACNRRFATAKALADHRSSTGHYPVHCTICNRGFGSDSAVQQHAQVHLYRGRDAFTESKAKSPTVISKEVTENAQHAGLRAADVGTRVDNVTSNMEVVMARLDLIDLESQFSEDNLYNNTVQAEKQLSRAYMTFQHKSNVYTLLSLADQHLVYDTLLLACHTPQRLHAERYTMLGLGSSSNNTNINHSQFLQTPQIPKLFIQQNPKRKAIAIDCEMVGLSTGKECVALLSAVDILTGEVLLNTYVNPMAPVRSWRTKYSGITRNLMDSAIKGGQALRGWRAARQALWQYIDAETILVGHALSHDLNVLGIMHSRIVDTAILSAQAVFPDSQDTHFPRQWGLKTLSLKFLDKVIQTGKDGHNCLEDTLATRELLLWCLQNPDSLNEWGIQEREEYDRRKALAMAKKESVPVPKDT